MTFRGIVLISSTIGLLMITSPNVAHCQSLQPIMSPQATVQQVGQRGSAAIGSMATVGSQQSGDSTSRAVAAHLEGDELTEETPYRMTGRYHLQRDSNQGYLVLQFELRHGNYIHSLTQAGELQPSTIRVATSNDLLLTGQFNPDRDPVVIDDDPIFHQRLEKHQESVQFFVPIKIRPDIDLKQFSPELIFDGQVCSETGCIPLKNKTVKARFAGYYERQPEPTSQQRENTQSTRRN